jgi:hypothetical protein
MCRVAGQAGLPEVPHTYVVHVPTPWLMSAQRVATLSSEPVFPVSVTTRSDVHPGGAGYCARHWTFSAGQNVAASE